MKVFVVIPAFDEERTIGEIITSVKKKVEDVNIIVVDDGSQDQTKEISNANGADLVYSNKINRGNGYSLKKGIVLALESGADIIITMDADGQHKPDQIRDFLTPIVEKKADVVIGTRFLDDSNINGMNFFNRVGNKFFTKVTNILSGQKFSDTQCGFRALSREAALRLNLMNDFNLAQELILDLTFKGMVIQEVPVSVPPIREFGQSRIVRNPVDYGARVMLIVLSTFRDHYPLKFFGSIGLPLILMGLISGSLMLATNVEERGVFYFWVNFEYTLIFLIGGFFLLTIALLAQINSRNRKLLEEILYTLRKNSKL